MKAVLWRRISHHWVWKLASVGLSFVLWLAIAAQPEVTALETLPVLYRNVPTDSELVPGAPETVRVELRGTPTALDRGNLTEATLILDLDGIPPDGIRTFTLSSNQLRLPQGVTFVRAIPSQVAIKIRKPQ